MVLNGRSPIRRLVRACVAHARARVFMDKCLMRVRECGVRVRCLASLCFVRWRQSRRRFR